MVAVSGFSLAKNYSPTTQWNMPPEKDDSIKVIHAEQSNPGIW